MHSKSNDPALAEALRRITAPGVGINGDHLVIDTDGLGRHGVEAISMPGVGHFAMSENPDAFNRVLAKAIGEIRRPPMTFPSSG